MKTIAKIAIVAVCFSVVGLAAISEAKADPCSGYRCNDTKIERLYPSGSSEGFVFVKPADGGLGSLTCAPVEGHYLRLAKSHVLFDEIYRALLATVLAKGEVSFRVNNSSGPCEILYITMSGE